MTRPYDSFTPHRTSRQSYLLLLKNIRTGVLQDRRHCTSQEKEFHGLHVCRNHVQHPKTNRQHFDIGAGPNMVRTFFLLLKWRDRTRTIHNRYLNSASDSPVHVIIKTMLFDQLHNLHLRVYVNVMDQLAVPLHIGKLFIDRFIKGLFRMDRQIFLIQFCPATTISEYTPASDPLAVLQTN